MNPDCACRLVLCSAYWIGVTKMRSRCCLLRSLTEDQPRLKRNKEKSRKRASKHPYRIKLRRRLNTFGPRGKAQSSKHLEFQPPHIDCRALENRAISLAVAVSLLLCGLFGTTFCAPFGILAFRAPPYKTSHRFRNGCREISPRIANLYVRVLKSRHKAII